MIRAIAGRRRWLWVGAAALALLAVGAAVRGSDSREDREREAGWRILPPPGPALSLLSEVTVGIDRNSNVAAVWRGSLGEKAGFASRGEASIFDRRTETWGRRLQLKPPPDRIDADLAPNGRLLVAWISRQGLFARTASTETGTWSPRVRLAARVSDFDATISARGETAVVWTDRYARTASVIGVFGRDGNWTAARPIDTGNGPHTRLRVALDESGQATVAWTSCIQPSRARCLNPDRGDTLEDADRALWVAVSAGAARSWHKTLVARGGRDLPLIPIFDVGSISGEPLVAWIAGTPANAREGDFSGTEVMVRRFSQREWRSPARVTALESSTVNYIPDVQVIAAGSAPAIEALGRLMTTSPDGGWELFHDAGEQIFAEPAVAFGGGSFVIGWTNIERRPRYVATRLGVGSRRSLSRRVFGGIGDRFCGFDCGSVAVDANASGDAVVGWTGGGRGFSSSTAEPTTVPRRPRVALYLSRR